MNRPIFIMVIGYIVGIIWGLYLKISIVPFYFLIILIYVIIRLPYSKKKFRIFSIKRYFRYLKLIFKFNIIIIIIISSFISNIIIKYQENKYERLFQNGQNVELAVVVIGNKEEKEYYNRYKVKIFSNEKLYINVDKKTNLEYGDKVQITGEFQSPQVSRNYKGFNYKQYLKTQKIYGTVKIDSVKLLERKCTNKLMQCSNHVFLKIKDNIEKTYSDKSKGIILGVMLGYTKQIDENIKQDFSNSNISHVLAVSGMHISYIIILITGSTKKILGKRKSKIIASIVLVMYMVITGFSVSVVRASVMGILSCLSFVFYRKSDTLNNIAIACLITLINNPYSIISVSFELTYGGTIGIIYLKPFVEKIIKNIKIKNRKWKYVFLRIIRKYEKIIEILSISISAQMVIAPIIMLNFNTIGIGFIFTNLLLSLIIGVIVMGGFVQILISVISVEFGKLLAKLIEIPIYGLILISKINIGNFKVVTPEVYQIVLYYFIVIVFKYLYYIFNSNYTSTTQRRIKNTIYLIKYKFQSYFRRILYVLILVVFVINIIGKISHGLDIYFIDVGQGDSTLIITPQNKTILIDGGGSLTYDVGKNILIPYLLDRKIKKIDYIIISHFDEDHVGGILSVIKELKVEKIIIGKQEIECEQYQEFCDIVKVKQIQVISVKKGDIINIEKDVIIKILFPGNELIKENMINNNSLVVKLEFKEFKMLFTGDIESITEQVLLKMYSHRELNANILKVPHHRFEIF